MGCAMRATLGILTIALACLLATKTDAHRSGCHRWHSCPSDTGSYVCGDLGYSNYCPNRTTTKKRTTTAPAANQVPQSTVITVQNYLKALGYNAGPSDGIVGWKTRTAVMSFQKDQGIAVDGQISESLRIRLSKAGQ